MSDENVKRRYDNRRRAARAQRTRLAILAAAHDCFVEAGYAGTTVPMIAQRAGTSVDSVHKHFGTKPSLARAVLDHRIAGDDQPMSMVDRPRTTEIAEAATGPEVLRRYAAHARAIHERLGPLASVFLFGARAGDRELRELTVEADSQRLRASSLLARHLETEHGLGAGVHRTKARDITWVLNSPEVHWLLTVERGWSEDEYEQLLADALIALLLGAGERSSELGDDRYG